VDWNNFRQLYRLTSNRLYREGPGVLMDKELNMRLQTSLTVTNISCTMGSISKNTVHSLSKLISPSILHL